MQCTSYLPGCYYSVDHNVGAGGSLWQLLNNGANYESKMAYNTLLEPHSSNLYYKEAFRQTMVQHEAIFRKQVQELHRLYSRQRELMDVTNVREPSQYDLQMQTSEPGSPSKSLNSRKRILDLELPADEYIESEEGEGFGEENSIEVPQVGYGSSKTTSESHPKINLKLNEGAPSNFNSSCSKGSYLFDLNEPMPLDDYLTRNSTSIVDLNISCMDFMLEGQDLSGKSTSKSLVLNEEIAYNILEKKGNEGSTLISGLELPLAEKSALSCDDRTSMCREFVKTNSELKDKNILSSEKARAISSCLAFNSSGKSNTYDGGGFAIANKTGEELSKSSICIHVDDSSREHPVSNAATQMINKMATGTILEAPVSPDNYEQSPPREESDDSQIEMPLHFSKQKTGDPNKDFDRIAAETIISISLSGVEQCMKTAPIALLKASGDCLDWLAGIVASVTVDLDNEFEGLLNDAPVVDSNLVAPSGMGQLKGTKVNHCFETSKQKNEKVPGILLSSQQESGLGRKARQRKNFQSEGLSCISSPSSCNVTENLQPIEKLINAASNTRGTVPSRKNVRGSCHARRSWKSNAFYPNLMKRSVRSLLRQHNSKAECSFLPSCLLGWGKKNRRQKSRRARTNNKFSFG